MDEYPRMIYRDGTAIDVNGVLVDTLIVRDAGELRAARLDGWRVDLIPHPLDHDGDGLPGGSLPKRRGRPPKALANAPESGYLNT